MLTCAVCCLLSAVCCLLSSPDEELEMQEMEELRGRSLASEDISEPSSSDDDETDESESDDSSDEEDSSSEDDEDSLDTAQVVARRKVLAGECSAPLARPSYYYGRSPL
jgi:hypothetical protein